jgi:hypothetical protein
MATPAVPKEDAILDRIVTVLEAITAGATYWYKPGRVQKRYVHWREYTGAFPIYMVTLGSGGERVDNSYANIDETFHISIQGYVKDNEDTSGKILRCWQDIRVALTAEMANGAAGSLPVLGAFQLRIRNFPETDNGYLIIENGLGFFEIDAEVHINDTVGFI